jgi:ankyrin repeat protein
MAGVHDAWFAAVKGNKRSEGERLLDEHKDKLDINAIGKDGLSALGLACHKGFSDYAAMLIKRGANMKKHSADGGDRPLRDAADNGHLECVRVLLDADAAVNETDGDGWSALHFAARGGFAPIVRLLLERGADRSLRSNCGWKYSALNLAEERKKTEVVALLAGPAHAALRGPLILSHPLRLRCKAGTTGCRGRTTKAGAWLARILLI